MAVIASLQFGNNDHGLYNKSYLVSNVRLHFSRNYNCRRPNSDARCESVTINVVAPEDGDNTLYEWYAKSASMTGRLLIENPTFKNNDAVFYKELQFEEARCMLLAEKYDIKVDRRRMITLAFEADSITFNGIEFRHL